MEIGCVVRTWINGLLLFIITGFETGSYEPCVTGYLVLLSSS
jgi:hypothetical protein